MLLLLSIFLVAILASLAFALRHLLNDNRESSARMVKFLTIRIALSVALFTLLLLAWWHGWIEPHGLAPPTATNPSG